MTDEEEIQDAITEAISAEKIIVKNPMKDGLHFEAIVVSEEFIGKSLIIQHQMVMDPLKPLFGSNLHALSLKTYTPNKWRESNE